MKRLALLVLPSALFVASPALFRGAEPPTPQKAEAELPKQGFGLKTELFAGGNFDRPVKTRVDSHIDFLWGDGAPEPDVPADNFSIRWTGFLRAPQHGFLKIAVDCDDHARVTIGKKLVIDAWKGGAGRRETTLELSGQPQEFQLEYRNVGGPSHCSLHWGYPGRTEIPIPADVFALDEETLQTPPPKRKKPPENGLMMQCFSGTSFQRLASTGYAENVCTLWSGGAPAANMKSDHFSVRYSGQIRAPKPGAYTLLVGHDDGARLWIDDLLVVNAWKHGVAQETVHVEFDDQPKSVRYEVFQDDGAGHAYLLWQPPNQSVATIIPSSAFRPIKAAPRGSSTKEK